MNRKVYIFALLILIASNCTAEAFWMWTPESNKWINPRYAVKETPKEQLDYAMEAYNAGDLKKATSEFRKLIKNYPRAREAAAAQYYIALCSEKQEQFFKAFKEYQIAIEKYPFSDQFSEIVKRQYDIGNLLVEGKGKRNKIVDIVIGGDYDIVEIFRTVIKNAPYGEYASPSQYKIGLYLQGKQMFQEARDEFEKTINDYPDSEWAKVAKYQIALADAMRSASSQYNQSVTEEAIAEFESFVEEYPNAELSEDAKDQIYALRNKEAENNFLIAVFYEKQKKYKSAKIYYTAVVENYKNTAWASKALAKIRELNLKINTR